MSYITDFFKINSFCIQISKLEGSEILEWTQRKGNIRSGENRESNENRYSKDSREKRGKKLNGENRENVLDYRIFSK